MKQITIAENSYKCGVQQLQAHIFNFMKNDVLFSTYIFIFYLHSDS